MTLKRIAILVGAAVAAAGLGAGLAATVGSGTPAPSASATAGPNGPGYSYYRSMMGRYYGGSGGPMMGGTSRYGWMMGQAGYQWMFGGTSAPAWMRGAEWPFSMMGTSADMGQFMGRLWAAAPGPRVSPQQAASSGDQVPAGAAVSRAAGTVTFTARTIRLVALASPAGGPDETFRIAGMVNPKIIVPAGARVFIEVINADPDTAHGLVITASRDVSSWMPMMTARPAFTGSALWFLGDPTAAGMHAGTLAFTAGAPGSYRYLCPVPGHVQKGMTGVFTVTSSG
jgi:Sulfocyanin (SoxE) domain